MCMPDFWDDPLCNLPFCATDRHNNQTDSPHSGRRPVAAPWSQYGQPTAGWQQQQGQQAQQQQAYSGNTPPGGFGGYAAPAAPADEMLVDELLQQEGERGLWSLVTDLFSGVGGGAAPHDPVLPVLSPTALNGAPMRRLPPNARDDACIHPPGAFFGRSLLRSCRSVACAHKAGVPPDC